jgi:hypothetical protein
MARETEGGEKISWHRLFGLVLTDFFTGSPFVVELEKDLSIKQQLLDVVILRKRKGGLTGRLPDGVDNLADHNLITFKSHQETLDDWALKELTGHYVNYRKQLTDRDEPLLSESHFRLYAVCSRFPHNLANEVPWERLRDGVYECRRGTDVIRVVVMGQLPQVEHNALLPLFSGAADKIRYGLDHYAQRTGEMSGVLEQLLRWYRGEGLAVPYTLKDFRRDYLKKLTPEERLEGLSPEERLKGLPAEEIERYLQQLRAAESAATQQKKPRPRGRRSQKR